MGRDSVKSDEVISLVTDATPHIKKAREGRPLS
jgi:hypothetical protein